MIGEAMPAGAQGPWWPNADLPADLADGRYVLLWIRALALFAFWVNNEDGRDWSTDGGLPPVPTMFAGLVHPRGAGPIHDLCEDD